MLNDVFDKFNEPDVAEALVDGVVMNIRSNLPHFESDRPPLTSM